MNTIHDSPHWRQNVRTFRQSVQPWLPSVVLFLIGAAGGAFLREGGSVARASTVECDRTTIRLELKDFERTGGFGDTKAEARWWLPLAELFPDTLELYVFDAPEEPSSDSFMFLELKVQP